jgi:hypothetical protein
MSLTVERLVVYPVKGARGIDVPRAVLRKSGLELAGSRTRVADRRFMIVAEDGTFLTQREHPTLVLVGVHVDDDALVLSTPSGRTASVALGGRDTWPARTVRVWNDTVRARDAGPEAARLLSDHLGRAAALVYLPDGEERTVEQPYGRPDDVVGFADAYPLLVGCLASLADLNARLIGRGKEPVTMDRFRPNIVLSGGEPYDEERFPRVTIGSVAVRLPKRCARCSVTTVDPTTARTAKEPLATLAGYRTEENKVHFAMNAIPDLGRADAVPLAVGDRAAYQD